MAKWFENPDMETRPALILFVFGAAAWTAIYYNLVKGFALLIGAPIAFLITLYGGAVLSVRLGYWIKEFIAARFASKKQRADDIERIKAEIADLVDNMKLMSDLETRQLVWMLRKNIEGAA